MKHLVKPLGTGMLTAVLCIMGTAVSYAQKVSYIIPTPKSELLPATTKSKSLAAATSSIKADYKLPVPLAYLGTISAEDNANSNLLFKHKDINEGAWLLASSVTSVS